MAWQSPTNKVQISLDIVIGGHGVTCVTRLVYLSIGEGSVVSERIAPERVEIP